MKIYLIICFTVASLLANAQDITESSKPQFTTQDSDEIARYLQQNKDIKTAVYLTQTAWQMSQSFASNEQLTSQWEAALEELQNPLTAFPTVNSHLTAGQYLIQYSDGMDLDTWRLIDLPLLASFDQNSNTTSASDYFSFYLNLPSYWQQLMANMNPESTWLKFPEFQTKTANKNKNKQASQLYRILKAVQTDAALSSTISENSWDEPFNGMQIALLRAQFHAKNEEWLALFYDWVEIYQLCEVNTQLLSADQQNQFSQLIEQTRELWQQQQETINITDERIFPMMLLFLNQIPEKFKNPDHFNETLNLLIFQIHWEMDKAEDYAQHVLRQDIQNNLEICLNLSGEQAPNPQPAMGKKQFQSCVDDFIQWGNKRAKNASLSGKLLALDGALAMSRALESPHFQIINFLSMSASNDEQCQKKIITQANPIEWILAAESLAWLHDRWPGLMADWADRNSMEQLLNTGQAIFQQPECLPARETLQQQFDTVKSHWLKLKAAIQEQFNTYRSNHLAKNSQIDFFQPVNQYTQLAADDIRIGPCDVAKACGAFVELPATTALLDLFPNHLKMAQQFGLGELQLCYENVEWKNRDTEPTHLDNNSIANYTGQLSLQLTGKYQNNPVFTKVITGESRHLYLFGENTEAVLDMACPLPIIGEQINTQLERGTFGLFPNRLTFLTAQRTNINSVISNNWTENENWQNKLSDENHSEFVLFDEKTEVKQLVNDAFLRHNDEVQQQIYRKLMYSNAARINDSALSLAVFEYLTERQLFNDMTQGLYPQVYLNTTVRSALKGSERLMDAAYFKSAFESQINLLDMLNKGDEILHKNKGLWLELPEPLAAGNLSSSLKQLKQVIQFSP